MKKLLIFLTLALSALFQLQAASRYSKPVISILGDSYSTFEGHIPEGNATWYTAIPVNDRTDVTDVRQTWWWQLISEGGYRLGVNDSYSGSTISYTGYDMADYRDRSFITRLPRIVSSDILLIFGATNDSWAGVPIGEYEYQKLTLGHLYQFRPALKKLLTEAQNRNPGTRIIFIINSELKPEITGSILETCNSLNVESIQLHDIDKRNGHPSIKGMAQIKDQILNYLRK